MASKDKRNRSPGPLWLRRGRHRASRLYERARKPAARALTLLPDGLERRLRIAWGRMRARAGVPPDLIDRAALVSMLERALDDLQAGPDDAPPGDYLEFGVHSGSSMICMHQALERRGLDAVRLIGFDSFEGLPADVASEDHGVWHAGQFATSEAATMARLEDAGIAADRLVIVRGFFADTLNAGTIADHKLERASIIMIDCDNYGSARTALFFCEPLIRRKAVIFLDDYSAFGLDRTDEGEKRAFDEFLSCHPHLRAERLGDYAPHGRVFRITRASPDEGCSATNRSGLSFG